MMKNNSFVRNLSALTALLTCLILLAGCGKKYELEWIEIPAGIREDGTPYPRFWISGVTTPKMHDICVSEDGCKYDEDDLKSYSSDSTTWEKYANAMGSEFCEWFDSSLANDWQIELSPVWYVADSDSLSYKPNTARALAEYPCAMQCRSSQDCSRSSAKCVNHICVGGCPSGYVEDGKMGCIQSSTPQPGIDDDCSPRTCAQMGYECGTLYDDCGSITSCYNCTAGKSCQNHKCVSVTNCTPKTCSQMGYECGSGSDGCGGALSCGGCGSTRSCQNNLCVANCTPKTCAELGFNCGTVDDGCGRGIFCGTCGSDETCENNKCVSLPISDQFISIPAGFLTFQSDIDLTLYKAGDMVRVGAFKMQKTPVTVAQYKQCVEAGGCEEYTLSTQHCALSYGHGYGSIWSDSKLCNYGTDDRENHPMNCLTYSDAQKFCTWIKARLPTIEEWIYAATHDGKEQRKTEYPWGNSFPEHCQTANFYAAEPTASGTKNYYCFEHTEVSVSTGTSPVGTYSPDGDSPLGLTDMLGNVAELVGRGSKWWWSEGEGNYPVLGAGYKTEMNKNEMTSPTLTLVDSVESTFVHDMVGFRCAR